jgi:hypothetical protein
MIKPESTHVNSLWTERYYTDVPASSIHELVDMAGPNTNVRFWRPAKGPDTDLRCMVTTQRFSNYA